MRPSVVLGLIFARFALLRKGNKRTPGLGRAKQLGPARGVI